MLHLGPPGYPIPPPPTSGLLPLSTWIKDDFARLSWLAIVLSHKVSTHSIPPFPLMIASLRMSRFPFVLLFPRTDAGETVVVWSLLALGMLPFLPGYVQLLTYMHCLQSLFLFFSSCSHTLLTQPILEFLH